VVAAEPIYNVVVAFLRNLATLCIDVGIITRYGANFTIGSSCYTCGRIYGLSIAIELTPKKD
jgi:hypothetical protein